jgi:ABC-type multidrug transport system ATPase subunit
MILKAENIAKSFGKKSVLRDVSLNMDAGSLEGIVGENGSGKSTLLKIIVGRWKADKGSISINGRMGYCPQKILLFPQLTVNENFRYFSAAYKLSKKEYLNSRDILLEYFNFRNFMNERIENLSGGTQQKLNLSLALLHQPDLLILDEPYNGFDWDTYLRFWEYADNLQNNGCAILIVTHLISEKQRFDRIYNLENGYLK